MTAATSSAWTMASRSSQSGSRGRRAARRVSLLNDVSHHCFNRRVARPSKRGRKRDDIITAHDLDAAAIRRAEQQMQRARDAVLRGDTYRVGGRHDAPTDRSSDVERQQSREYIAARKRQG